MPEGEITDLDQIFGAVYSEYKIPIVVLPDELELENVATVFERINSKGTPLGTFDLLNARFRLYKIVLQNLWDKTKDDYDLLNEVILSELLLPITCKICVLASLCP